MKVRYHVDDDAGIVYACLGTMASDGLLRIWTPISENSSWEWLAPGSDEWDAAHQKIYRNGRVTPMQDAEAQDLPPLPDSSTQATWEPASETIEAGGFPALTRFLRLQDSHAANFVGILYEDTYESSSGDGEFHYFSTLGRSEEEARAGLPPLSHGYVRYHVRRVRLVLDGAVIRGEFQRDVFDNFTVQQVCAAANVLVRHD